MIKGLLNLRLLLLSKKLPTSVVQYPANFCSNISKGQLGEIKNEESNVNTERKLKVLQLEVDVARQEGRRVPDPSKLKKEHWDHILSLNTRSARNKYYTFLWQIEKKKENREQKKIQRQEELRKRKEEEKRQSEECNHIIYGLSHTCFLLRIYDTTINTWNNNRLIQAMQYGEKVVLDCSYDEFMTQREAVNAAKQLMMTFAENRMHDDPFDLHFCNANMNGTTMKYLEKHIPTLREPSFPFNLHEKCYTSLFPKERLVYLTPHCKNDLLKYNPDDIYIIGAMVDKINNEPLSLAKAKRQGLRMAKFPLDRYLQWGSGSGKSLTINQVLDILLDLKKSGDWKYALRHVPRRKIINTAESDDEIKEKIQVEKLRSRAEDFKFDIDSWGSGKKRIRNQK